MRIVVADRPPKETRIGLVDTATDPTSALPVAGPGPTSRVYRLDPAEQGRLSAFQDRVRALTAADIHGTLEVTVDAQFCGSGAAAGSTPDVFVRTAIGEPFIRARPNVPAADLVTGGATALPACR